MVTASTLNLLVATRAAAIEAKQERARAMDTIIDLLFERAAAREMLREALPYLMQFGSADDLRYRIEVYLGDV